MPDRLRWVSSSDERCSLDIRDKDDFVRPITTGEEQDPFESHRINVRRQQVGDRPQHPPGELVPANIGTADSQRTIGRGAALESSRQGPVG
jgi:hypothetical protein